MHIITINKNYDKAILLGLLIIITIIMILSSSITTVLNNQQGECITIFLSLNKQTLYWKLLAGSFLLEILGYLFASLIALPILGIIMAIQVLKIRINSRKLGIRINSRRLIASGNLKQKHNLNAIDIKLLISQIFASSFAIFFNMPFAIANLLYPGTLFFPILYIN